MNNYNEPITDGQSKFLSDYSERDKKWDSKRTQVCDVEELYETRNEHIKLAKRMHSCSDFLSFGWSDNTQTGESRLKLTTAQFCHVRHCPVCQWRRSMRNIARFEAKLPDIQTQYPTHRFLFLTLTVPNPRFEDLRTKLAEMNKGWDRLIKRKEFPATGWIRTTEVTNEQVRKGFAHPHFHVLMMVPPRYFKKDYVSQARWLELWRECMRDDSITQVDIRAVKPGADLSKAVRETLKYSMKVEDGLLDPDFLFCLTTQLHKTRFLASGGVFKDILKEEMSDKEMIEGDELNEDVEENKPSLSFQYKYAVRRYVRFGV